MALHHFQKIEFTVGNNYINNNNNDNHHLRASSLHTENGKFRRRSGSWNHTVDILWFFIVVFFFVGQVLHQAPTHPLQPFCTGTLVASLAQRCPSRLYFSKPMTDEPAKVFSFLFSLPCGRKMTGAARPLSGTDTAPRKPVWLWGGYLQRGAPPGARNFGNPHPSYILLCVCC